MKEQKNPGGTPLWMGRSSGSVDSLMVKMGESISLDINLYEEDIAGSLAHAAMLRKAGILNDKELTAIQNGLRQIKQEIENGELEIRFELEDIHTHIENRLTELTGEAGKKLHTARSRNDQVAVDTHLYVRKACLTLKQELIKLCTGLVSRAEEHTETVLPGYTHMQVAQPIRLSHHLLAHFWAFLRDIDRFDSAYATAQTMPLGSGAMAGVNYETDREMMRESLGFQKVSPNSMDAVANRDHILDFLYASSVFVSHASRLCEEIILWNSVEFSFLSLPDSLTTGSSIMPQKKNPDLAELIRGKTGRIYGNLFSLLTNLKGLPLTYNRDLQEDRQPLIDTFEQCSMILPALSAMITEAVFHGENMQSSLEKGFSTATDLADSLVTEKHIPFREAHHIAGKLVSVCAANGWKLSEIPQNERSSISAHLSDDDFYNRSVDLKGSTDRKKSYGGTSLKQQKIQLQEAKKALEAKTLPDSLKK